MNNIAVLITVFNRKERTLKCLSLLYEQAKNIADFNIEVFLTNDGCTDGTPEAVGEQFPAVHIVNGDGNLFWNHGMIEAWKAAVPYNPDFYLWLNDDVELYPDAIERLMCESTMHKHHAIIGGSMCSSFDNKLVSYGGRVSRHKLIQDVSKPQRCNTLSGNLVLIPRYVYNRIGMNDSYYRHSMGDLDYTLTANENGIEVWIARGFFGVCNREDKIQGWADPNRSLYSRINYLYSIRGNNPLIEYHFNKKHYGIVNAAYRFLLSHIHTIFPQIWNL